MLTTIRISLVLVAVTVGVVMGARLRPQSQHGRAATPQEVFSPDVARSDGELSIAPPSRGAGLIRGRVLTVDDEPLEGVRIVASVPFPAVAPPDEGTELQASVDRAVAKYKWTLATKRTAITATDGSFALSGLADAAFNVYAEREGYRILPADGEHAEGRKDGDSVKFVAVRQRNIQIDVRLPDGTQPEQAMLVIGSDLRERRMRWRPTLNQFLLDGTECDLVATVGPSDRYQSERTWIAADDDSRDDDSRMVTLQLVGRLGVVVRVSLPEGWSRESLSVRVGLADEFEPSGFAQLKHRTKKTRDGSFVFFKADLEPGQYVVAASMDRSVADASAVVELDSSTVECVLRIESFVRANILKVRLTGPDGLPVNDVLLHHRAVGPSGRSQASRSGAKPLQLGQGVFVLKFGSPEPSSTHTIHAESKKYGTINARFDAGSEETLEMRFGAAANVVVQIDGYASSEHAGYLRTYIVSSTGDAVKTRGSVTTEGVQQFQPVQVGEAELVLEVLAEPGGCEISRRKVMLQPGENQLSVAIPKLYSLRVLREQEPADFRERTIGFRLIGSTGYQSYRHAKLESDGSTIVRRLAAGRYVLTGSVGGKAWTREVSVPGDSDVRIP